VSRRAALVVVMLAATILTGCSSSFEQSRKLEAEGSDALAGQKGVAVNRSSKDLDVTGTAVIHDENGAAAVVTLRSSAKTDQVDAPIAIDVVDRKGTSVFKNDTPGLEPSLTHVPVVRPGETFDWVNDQVQAAGTPAKVKARVGNPPKAAPGTPLPKLTVSGVRLENDATSGVLATGTIRNDSKVLQVKLVAFGVVRDGDKVVAAGRAGLPKLKPGKDLPFRMFFIGDPRKGKLTISVPPSTLG